MKHLNAFVDETASESPAPGGGSIAAYCGSLGVALATMVANLSASKKGWEERWNEFSDWADKGQNFLTGLIKGRKLKSNCFIWLMKIQWHLIK